MYTVDYKTPLNSKKRFEPTTVAVTKANKHLDVELIDDKDNSKGKVNIAAAKEMADKLQLKLVCIDEKSSPPKFKMLSGKELHKLQMDIKEKNREKKEKGLLKNVKEKEIDLNLGIGDHDLANKLKITESLFNKGHIVKIKVFTKKVDKELDATQLQNNFIKKLEESVKFTKLKLERRSANIMVFAVLPKS